VRHERLSNPIGASCGWRDTMVVVSAYLEGRASGDDPFMLDLTVGEALRLAEALTRNARECLQSQLGGPTR
jgi:hypothetical protein